MSIPQNKRIRMAASAAAAGALLVAPVVTIPTPEARPVNVAMAYTKLDAANIKRIRTEDPRKTTREVTTDRRFALVGVVFDSAAEARPVEVRTKKADGSWSEWKTLVPQEDGPDANTEEAKNAKVGTPPLTTGQAQTVQLRVPNEHERQLEKSTLVTVDPGTSPADGKTMKQPMSSAQSMAPAPRIISRGQWGANESYHCGKVNYSDTIRAGVLHHTDGANEYSAADAAAQVRGIYAYHTRTLGWCDVGYNFIVDRYGNIYEGRRGGVNRAVQGAHTAGFNNRTFGVAMMGSFNNVHPTAAQYDAAATVLAWKLGGNYRNPQGTTTLVSGGKGGTNVTYPAGQAVNVPVVMGHRNVGSTDCPGDKPWGGMVHIRNRVTQLMGDIRTPIWHRWQADGGEGGWLGAPAHLEVDAGIGRAAGFQRGSVLSSRFGTHVVNGEIEAGYYRLGGPWGVLQHPSSASWPVAGGWAQNFNGVNGAIYWHQSTGPKAVLGGIRQKWESLGGPGGGFGFPISDDEDVPGYTGGLAKQSRFQGGGVLWSPRTGVHPVSGRILQRYYASGGPAFIGLPVTDPYRQGPVTTQRFEGINGAIYESQQYGAVLVLGGIRARYESNGGPEGRFGLPVMEERDAPGGRESVFERGIIRWNRTTGAITEHPRS